MSDLLRSCAGCSAHILTNDGKTESVYCKKCHAKRPTFEEWAATLTKGSRVYVQPTTVGVHAARTEHIVLTRDGDKFELQPLGRPGVVIKTHLSELAQETVAPRGRWA